MKKLVQAIVGLMAFALIGIAGAAEVGGKKTGADSEAIEQEAVSLLVEYLRVDTTNPPGNEIKAAQFFKAIFDREGIEARIIESAPGRGNIYARLKGGWFEKGCHPHESPGRRPGGQTVLVGGALFGSGQGWRYLGARHEGNGDRGADGQG